MLMVNYSARTFSELFEKVLSQRQAVLAKAPTPEILEMLQAFPFDGSPSYYVKIIDFTNTGRLVVQFDKSICSRSYILEVTLEAKGNGFVYSKANSDIVKRHRQTCVM